MENKVAVNEAVKKAAFERMGVERTGEEPFLKESIFTVLDNSYTVGDYYSFVQNEKRRRIKALGYLPAKTEQKYLDELIEKFDLSRVSHAGAKFDFEKAKWYNAEWIKRLDETRLAAEVHRFLAKSEIANDAYFKQILELVKERLVLLNDFWPQASFFFTEPTSIDVDSVKPKWSSEKEAFFTNLIHQFNQKGTWDSNTLEELFKVQAEQADLKVGELMLPFRIMLVGGKFGPAVFDIAAIIGKEKTLQRIQHALPLFAN
jgi:glutamyl-tRNA synthetase